MKDINQILDDAVIPEMEYDPHEKTSSKTYGVTLDDIPEFELPKTKAEVFREAKDRLSEKTVAASKAYKRKDGKKKRAAKDEAAAVSQTADPSPVTEPVWVGSADELIPFAWRNPLIPGIAGQTKLYKKVVHSGAGTNMPAIRE